MSDYVHLIFFALSGGIFVGLVWGVTALIVDEVRARRTVRVSRQRNAREGEQG